MDEPPGQTSENKLKVMPINEFQRLLEVCVDHTQAKTTEQTKIIHELQSNPNRTQPEESQQGLTNSKYNSSSLQSLNDKDKQGKHSKVSTAAGVSNRPAESRNIAFPNSNHWAAVSSMNTVTSTSSLSYQSNTGRDSGLSPSGRSLIDEDRKDRSLRNHARDGREPSLNPGGKFDLQLDDRFTSVTSCLPPHIPPSYYKESPDQSNYRLQSQSPPSSAQTSVFSSSYSNSRPSVSKRSTPNHKNGNKKGRKQVAPLYAKDMVLNYRGDTADVDELVAFVKGNELKKDKSGPKKKEHDYRDKYGGSDGLGKSLSLDDDNLQLAAKKSTDKVRCSSLKDVEQSSRLERDEKETSDSDVNKPGTSMTRKTSVDNQPVRRGSDLEDNSPVRDHVEPNFTVVRRKKKNKTACTTSPSDTADPRSSNRKDSRRSRSRGERRKSVGSVQASDNSEGSDDGSVRSLPAGECTRRENIPKSCASSGGTPQTSYADITRLTREEEATKELQQTPEDYPSLHGSDNCEGSEDGSDLSAGGFAAKTPGSRGFTGGPPLTSYAAIAKFASGRAEEKREDSCRETGPQEFPDLPATSEPIETLPSSKSDVRSTVSHNNTSESAFPELISNSLAKNFHFDVPVNNAKLVTNTSSADPICKTKITAESPSPSEAYHGSKAQMLSTSPVPGSESANHPPGKGAYNTVTSNGFSCNAAGRRGHNSAAFTVNPSAVESFISDDPVTNESVSRCQHFVELDMNGIVVNGHKYEAENEKEAISDNTGAKFQRHPVKTSRPSFAHATTENDTGDGQCTEAVVFCGENFKEPPMLPDSGLELEFGFEMKEVLMDFSKKTFVGGSGLDFTGNLPSEVEDVCPEKEFTQNKVSASQCQSRQQDSRDLGNLDHGDVLYNRARNHSFNRGGKYSAPNYSDDNNQGYKSNETSVKNKRGNSGFDKGLFHKSTGGKINKKHNQNISLHDTTQMSSVTATLLPVDGTCNQSVPVVAAYSVPAIGPHPVSAIPTTVYGIQGYALSVPAGHSPYPNRGNPVQTLPTMVPVPMAPIFDGQVAQFPSPVSFIPAPVSASVRQPSTIVSVSAKVQRHPVSEDTIVTKSFEKSARSDATEEYFDGGYNPVPEHEITQPQQYEAGVSANADSGTLTSDGDACREILPVNFAQYYLPPDSSLYSQANMDGLRSYLEKREQECYQHSQQSSYSVRSLT